MLVLDDGNAIFQGGEIALDGGEVGVEVFEGFAVAEDLLLDFNVKFGF